MTVLKRLFLLTLLPALSVPAAHAGLGLGALKKDLREITAGPHAYDERIQQAREAGKNPFGIELYRPTYVLPFYLTRSPDYDVYSNHVISNEELRKVEFAAQFSFRLPVWSEIHDTPATLYAAYTQLFFWQVYADSAYFRETNYEPELFFSGRGWDWLAWNAGAVHQSNGRGGVMERSWNRVFGEAVLPFGRLTVSLKPWLLMRQSTSSDLHNRDIADFLGHGQLLLNCKLGKHVFSLMTRNNLESGFSRGSVQFSWTFPLFGHFRGMAQVFSGYGQSLIEYNHCSTSGGVGIALNDWL